MKKLLLLAFVFASCGKINLPEIEDESHLREYALAFEREKKYDIASIVGYYCEKHNVNYKFACGILLTENPRLKADAVNVNKNGTKDRSLWQLNDRWFELDDESDVFESTDKAVAHIAYLADECENSPYWTAVAYNSGLSVAKSKMAVKSVRRYADNVVAMTKKDLGNEIEHYKIGSFGFARRAK